MQEKPFYVHVELHKEIVKNAWIISHEGRKILVIEFQDTVTEDESITYVFALAKSLVSEKTQKCRNLLTMELKWRDRTWRRLAKAAERMIAVYAIAPAVW